MHPLPNSEVPASLAVAKDYDGTGEEMATKMITYMGGCHMNYKVKTQTHMITSIWGSTFAIPLCSQVKDLSSAEVKVLTESLTLDKFIEQQLVKLRFQSRV